MHIEKVYIVAIFFTCCVAFVILSLYQILARNSKLSISELIKQNIITISNIDEIFISSFGARLKCGKYSFPLQRYTENYRNIFNNYIASIIKDVKSYRIYKGKVDYFSDKDKKIDYSKIFYNIPWAIILLDAIIDIPLLVMVLIFIMFIILFFFEGSGSWKFSNNEIAIKYFFQLETIDLSKVKDFEILIPNRKLEFELRILSELSTYTIRDKKLIKLLPIVSFLNGVGK